MLGRFLNTKEIAVYLHCSTSYIRHLEALGMPYHKFPGGIKYFLFQEVDDWLKESFRIN